MEFVADPDVYEKDSTTNQHAENQASAGAQRIDEEYLIPYLRREPAERILDAGCGIGRTVKNLIERGYDAYGIDLPCLAEYWSKDGNDPGRFFCCDAARLPFPDGYFDVVLSMGVIEHIGTIDGDCTLADDYRSARQFYADELIRVTRTGGRMLIACPNKRFPIDPQHTASDRFSPDTAVFRLRNFLFEKTGLNIHRTWGKYHLLSYSEVEQLFIKHGGAHEMEALPIKGYFGLTIFGSGFLRPFGRLAEVWINDMPAAMRATSLNPYVMVQVRK
ncbi:MAG: methyltransferase domain-containing protein [Actinobacteria bacterium]|nr:methyltransferase domain-containing protein [Actinomycetota bacterium]